MSSYDIPTIVLTGGPCAGKTTVLSFLTQKLSDLGFTVVTVSKSATELKLSGIAPQQLPRVEFQRHLLEYMIEKEDRWKRILRLMPGDKKVLICDRGTLDSAAYMPEHEFDLLLGQLGYSLVDLRDKRYDSVVFLRSVAIDAPEIYTCLNNAARGETIDEARSLDGRTLDAWVGHSHLHIIDNSTDLEGKIMRVFKTVCRTLGIPQPLEIERKFLISPDQPFELPSPVQSVDITQYYLKCEQPGLVERIRERSQNGGRTFYHTFKEELRPGVRSEIERQITSTEYYGLLGRADPGFARISKTRRCFVWENQYFELDTFPKLSGLILLELELTDESDTIKLPDFLAGIVTDVTDDPLYSNFAISRRLAEMQ